MSLVLLPLKIILVTLDFLVSEHELFFQVVWRLCVLLSVPG